MIQSGGSVRVEGKVRPCHDQLKPGLPKEIYACATGIPLYVIACDESRGGLLPQSGAAIARMKMGNSNIRYQPMKSSVMDCRQDQKSSWPND